jgi:hypothetical protein
MSVASIKDGDIEHAAAMENVNQAAKMIFAVELAVLQRENQHHEDRHPDFFACAEWFGS